MLAVIVSVAAFAGVTDEDNSRLTAVTNAKKERTLNARLIFSASVERRPSVRASGRKAFRLR
jgi:hypothetical protein